MEAYLGIVLLDDNAARSGGLDRGRGHRGRGHRGLARLAHKITIRVISVKLIEIIFLSIGNIFIAVLQLSNVGLCRSLVHFHIASRYKKKDKTS